MIYIFIYVNWCNSTFIWFVPGNTAKLCKWVIERRMWRETPIPKNLYGLILERSTMEVLHLLRRLMEYCSRHIVGFTYGSVKSLDKAFDQVLCEVLSSCLEAREAFF